MSDTQTERAVEPETDLDPDEALEPSATDEEPEPDAELEPEPAEPEPDDGPSSQAIMEALEKEHRRHQTAVSKALGIDPDTMHECPTCEGVGFTPEPIDAPPPLVQDPFTEKCPRCQGNGETLSGATSRGLYAIPCNGCGGSGYVTKQEQPNAGANLGNGFTPPPAYAPPPSVSSHELAELESLRARGYTILEPIIVPPHVPA